MTDANWKTQMFVASKFLSMVYIGRVDSSRGSPGKTWPLSGGDRSNSATDAPTQDQVAPLQSCLLCHLHRRGRALHAAKGQIAYPSAKFVGFLNSREFQVSCFGRTIDSVWNEAGMSEHWVWRVLVDLPAKQSGKANCFFCGETFTPCRSFSSPIWTVGSSSRPCQHRCF